MRLTKDTREALLKEYAEVSKQFGMLTDIRFKLLAFLPTVSAVAFGFKGLTLDAPMIAFSAFGLAVTLALVMYNSRNDQLYDELVGRAAEIERLAGLKGGGFANRPRAWLDVPVLDFKTSVNHRNAVALIYAATCGLWLFGMLLPTLLLLGASLKGGVGGKPLEPQPAAVLASLTVSAMLVGVAWHTLKENADNKRKQLRTFAKQAMAMLDNRKLSLSRACEDAEFRKLCAQLAGKSPSGDEFKSFEQRAKKLSAMDQTTRDFYMPRSPRDTANAHFIALLTDLPPRWLLEVHRRH